MIVDSATSRVLLFLILIPGVAFAEVMDKEPTVAEVWITAVVGALVGFAAARVRPWMILLALPLTSALPLFTVLETYDSFVGPAIRREAGDAYIVQAHLAFMLVVLGNLTGAVIHIVRKRRSIRQDES